MTSGELERPAAPPGPTAGAVEPTDEERAAAAAMLQLIGGIHVSRAVYVLAALGIADRLADGPKTAADLAAVTGTDPQSLYRVLRLLAALDVLTENPRQGFGLTLTGQRLRSDVPASVRSWAMLVDCLGGVRAFEPFLDTIRTGTPGVDLAHGMDIFGYLATRPESRQEFQAAMSERTAAFAPSVAAGYDFTGMHTVADIGGGNGTLLAAVLHRHERLRGVLFDLPAVVADAAPVLRAEGVADRCDTVGGDFFTSVPPGADAYLLANVVHDWDDVRAAHILANCRQAMPENGRVLVIERLIPDDPHAAIPVLLSDLNMLVFTGGQERTTIEYGQLLADADLKLTAVQPVAPPYGVIEARALP
jgi:hypothetical protein